MIDSSDKDQKPNSELRLMIVAGEASGDKHGASLARAMRTAYPDTRFEFFGSGGDEMRAAGVETVVDARDVAIIGVPEIIRAIGKLFGAYRRLIHTARERRPKAIVLIDWPDFNMRLARRLHREGFKIIYYISPQVWAWRRYRIRALRRDVDRMLVILPFEEEFYRQAKIKVEYVGHPLVETTSATAPRDEFSRRHSLDPARPIVALLPGSRKKEVHYHLPAMLDASARLSRTNCFASHVEMSRRAAWIEASTAAHPAQSAKTEARYLRFEISNPQSEIHKPQFIIPLASTIEREQVEALIKEGGAAENIDLQIIERDTANALAHAEIAVVASGTATVEAALMRTPMVIVYRASELNYRLLRPLIHLDTFGMINLIAGRRVVPELLQHAVTGEEVAREVEAIITDRDRLIRMQRDLEEVIDRLGAGSGAAAERAARAVMSVALQSEDKSLVS